MSTLIQISYQLLILSLTIALSIARPQNAIENQDSSDQSAALSDIQKYYAAYRLGGGPSGYLGVEEPNLLERLQMQMMKPPVYGGNSLQSGPNWETMYRIPEIKRQVRYRQCYFNPISCFKK